MKKIALITMMGACFLAIVFINASCKVKTDPTKPQFVSLWATNEAFVYHTPTPCGYPGNTCTPSPTRTPTVTLTPTVTITPTLTPTPTHTPV